MSFSNHLRYSIRSAWEILYPRLCLHCQRETAVKSQLFCMHCLHDYVETDYHLIQDNPVSMHFYGRVKIERATSLLDFKKGSLSQSLLHELKYNHRKEIGIGLGERMGEVLSSSSFLEGVDGLIPVPLHPKKLKRRGFNQSLLFAQGMSHTTGLEVFDHQLHRVLDTPTQTRKSRMARIENVAEAFKLRNTVALRNKHILLVDDVITTGATLEACVTQLIDKAKARVSVAAIALG